MLRHLHSVPGLMAAVFLALLAVSGMILAADPVMERAGAITAADDDSVAVVAARVKRAFPGVERIDRRANGAIVVGYATADEIGSVIIDPTDASVLAQDAPGPVMVWVKSLHRSLLLEDFGRGVVGVLAGVLVLMGGSGVLLLVVAQGGWRRVTRPLRSAPGAGRWHVAVGRAAVVVLMLSALTGVWMSLATFGFVEDGSASSPEFPFDVAGTPPVAVDSLAGLQGVALRDLTRLTFPQPGDAADVFGVQTTTGSGFVDQATGAVLTWLPHGRAQIVWEWAYALHTGQGLWGLAVILAVAAAAIPVLSVTGTMVWAKRRRARPRIAQNARAGQADTVILVGSEGGSTWGFARSLHRALVAQGFRVHCAPMNAAGVYPAAQRMLILAATYGDGAAPANATRFLERVAQGAVAPVPVAVLGFGDRMFPQFCGFAQRLADDLAAKGWPVLHGLAMIDRQSGVDFAAWARDLGAALGCDLVVDHRAEVPKLRGLRLLSRVDYGQEVQAPTAILRFGAVGGGWFGPRLPRFQAGDLVGIMAPGSDLPRYYSLASGRADGVLEICVRKSPGGLCSGHLHGLAVGDDIHAFIRPNPAFRPQRGAAPVVMIAAGCGIGPMAGFMRANRRRREMELYFGLRDPGSDFLYEGDLAQWQAQGRLARLVTAVSRGAGRAYVQDRLRDDAGHLRDLIGRGGQIMVCGGLAMARAVADEVDHALVPLGVTVAGLRAEGRYLEDVY